MGLRKNLSNESPILLARTGQNVLNYIEPLKTSLNSKKGSSELH